MFLFHFDYWLCGQQFFGETTLLSSHATILTITFFGFETTRVSSLRKLILFPRERIREMLQFPLPGSGLERGFYFFAGTKVS